MSSTDSRTEHQITFIREYFYICARVSFRIAYFVLDHFVSNNIDFLTRERQKQLQDTNILLAGKKYLSLNTYFFHIFHDWLVLLFLVSKDSNL